MAELPDPPTGPTFEDRLARLLELMMGFTVYLGLPVVSARRAHLTIGLLDHLFTPTEAAGIGATGAFAIALARRTLTWRSTLDIPALSPFLPSFME